MISLASERWGDEVVAIVQAAKGEKIEDKDVLEECARRLARYKLPKAIVYVDVVKRGDNGKADIRWAKRVAEESYG